MSTAGIPAIDVHYSIDNNQNCSFKNGESLEDVTKSEKSAENLPDQLQFGHGAAAVRKSSFVITDILPRDDDFDDSDSTLLADQPVEFEVAESPKRTETLGDGFLWASPPVVSGISLSDSYSRFRVVKIESRDRWHRGRWTCHDFADPPERAKTEQMVENDAAVDSVTLNGTSIYYIPGVQDTLKSPFGIVYNTGGHPVLEANLLPSSPRYARGFQFFSSSSSMYGDTSEDMLLPDVTSRQFLSQRISTVDETEPAVSHSAARKLFADGEAKFLTPLKVSVSAPLPNDAGSVEIYKTPVARQLSSCMLMTADAVQKATGQTSPLDVMMSATLGPSASEPDMR